MADSVCPPRKCEVHDSPDLQCSEEPQRPTGRELYDRLQGHQADCTGATPLRHGVVKTGRVRYILGEYRDRSSTPLKSVAHLH